MIATWMAYGLVVAVLLAAAARGAEAVLRSIGLPTRLAWATALALLLCLVALAPARSGDSSPALPPQARIVELVAGEVAPHGEAPAENAPASVPVPRLDLTRWLSGSLAAITRLAPRHNDRAVILAWLGLTLLALGVIAVTHGRLRRRRRRWPVSHLHGQRVRVSDDFGPAVIGIGRPEIVVPRWLLQLPPADNRLVVAHEAEHVRARDPLLLFLGWAATALLAWNPAAWWMLSRLRLGVEVDCDTRMLARGVNTQAYASLLIRLVDRHRGPRLGMVAVSARRSHLERRLLAMTSPAIRRRPLATATAAILAFAAVLAACAAELPNSNDPGRTQVADAQGLPSELEPPATGSAEATRAQAETEVSQEVAQEVSLTEELAVEVPLSEGLPVEVPLTVSTATDEGADHARLPGQGDSAPPAESPLFVPMALPEPSIAPAGRTPPNPFGAAPSPARGPRTDLAPSGPARTIVYLVDGVRADVADNAPVVAGHPMYGLEGDEIEQIAVLTCQQATRIVPEAVDGLIVVRTRGGPDDGIDLPPSRHLRGVDSGTLRPRSCEGSLAPRSVRGALSGSGMLIVDGQRATREQALAIPAAAIASISLPQRSVTPAELVEAYGPDAAEGVAVVTTKRGDWRPGIAIGP